MDTKQYKFVGKDFDIEAAPTKIDGYNDEDMACLLYTSPSPRD